MQMFRTSSGSMYFVDGDKLHRANENVKVIDRSGVESLLSTFRIIRTIVAPTFGAKAFFETNEGHIETTHVVEVSEVNLPSWMLPEVHDAEIQEQLDHAEIVFGAEVTEEQYLRHRAYCAVCKEQDKVALAAADCSDFPDYYEEDYDDEYEFVGSDPIDGVLFNGFELFPDDLDADGWLMS